MEVTKLEMEAIEQAAAAEIEKEPRLNNLQLAFAGGGIADPVFA